MHQVVTRSAFSTNGKCEGNPIDCPHPTRPIAVKQPSLGGQTRAWACSEQQCLLGLCLELASAPRRQARDSGGGGGGGGHRGTLAIFSPPVKNIKPYTNCIQLDLD